MHGGLFATCRYLFMQVLAMQLRSNPKVGDSTEAIVTHYAGAL